MADSKTLFTLLECAAGYALFEVVAFEEIGSLLEDNVVTDLKRFGRAVKLKGFQPFESAHEALENANAISEHAMTGTLHNFLELNLPKVSKKKGKTSNFSLGLIDPGLATAVSEGLGISCRSDDTIREISRGCRLHLESFIKGLTGGAAEKAQLGLGHSYSRSKVKFNPHRSDNMIIQSIALLDQLDKDVNTFAMRVREWYSWHFPELRDLVKDNIMYARAAAFIQNKNSLFSASSDKGDDDDDDEKMETEKEDKTPALAEIVGDEEIAKSIVAAARTSMGMDCSSVDMINIVNFTERMVKLAEYRRKLSLYLTDKMEVVAPNLSALIGDTVAARLISKAGSLTNLAKAPASTVQILGAEKALFRALKTKGNTPKYGLIYHSTFIGRADAKNKGRISRYLANKCSIATRIDSFSDEPNRLYGEKLRDQVEERLKFYETGAAPRRNVDVMEEVARELRGGKDSDDDEEMKEVKSDKKKKKKGSDDDDDDEAVETPKSKKEKKKEKKSSSKKRKAEETEEADDDSEEEKKSAKKAKKEEKKKKKDKKKRKSKD
ncbi:Nucleolar protein 58 [Seminavis robusta]|uniref:Nucleolar protein 56 n=1 Tax=Seminavis robusta TaxID=568900 RepID=A0A9N8EEL6_9STRA|nr:Nucleolar protein 58 [Seminavis robusta]|eukprot:Sro827_g207860.1 Nucleolar protein 58 (551) ;mRNA; r:29333-31171